MLWKYDSALMTSSLESLTAAGVICNLQVIKESIEKWEKMCKVEDEGGRPIHRAREWQQASRGLEKELKRGNWHKVRKDQVSAPLIIDPTPGELTSKLKEACVKFKAATGIHVTVRERAGRSVRKDGQPEPFRQKGCGRENCLCCSSGNPGECETNSVGYRITCDTCLVSGKAVVYEGESGRNAYSRGLEHQADLRNKVQDSPLWKHCLLEHEGQVQTFKMRVLRCFTSCLDRLCNEAVRITESKAELVMNSKSEWHQAPIRRVVPTHGLQEEQGEYPASREGWLVGRGGGPGGRAGGRAGGRGARGRGRQSHRFHGI